MGFIVVRVLTVLLHDTLPLQLRDWSTEAAAQSPANGALFGIAGAVIFLSWLVALVGLFCLQKWARWICLFSVVAGYADMTLSGPVVSHEVTGAVDGPFAVLSSVTLALAFFTTALDPRPQAAPGISADVRAAPGP
jgi:hypothetical protein